MAESKTAATPSQAQQIPGMDAWKKMMDEQTARMGQLFDELAKAHTRFVEYGNGQIDEAAELWKTQFNYVNSLYSDYRRISMDATKKTFEHFAP